MQNFDVSWIVEEDLLVKITSCDDGKSGGASTDHLTLEITRQSNGDRVTMNQDWNGDLTFNGEYIDLGDCFPQFLGLLDEVAELTGYRPWERIGVVYPIHAPEGGDDED